MAVHPRSPPLGSAPLRSDWPDAPADRHPVGETAGEISTEIVGLLRSHTGRGPTQARTTISSDLIVVTLAGCLTAAEVRLTSLGHGELVSRARHEFHQGMRAEATAMVERLTGRQVYAYLTDQEHDPDLAVIVFMLSPPAPLRAVRET